METSWLAWRPYPDIWLTVVVLLGGYFYALSAWGPSSTGQRRAATRGQIACFCVGVLSVWLAADWPVHNLADRLFSIHMLQHLVFSLVSAPLLILGTPGWLLRRLLRPRAVRAVFRAATQPLIALTLMNLWIAAYHLPFMVNASVHNDFAHFLMHGTWLGLSVVFWWPVVSPLPELPHLSYPGRMLYLFAQSIVPTVPASFLTFNPSPLYDSYAGHVPLWGLDVVADQQVAGLLMKIGGGLLIWGIIAALFFRWHAEEHTGGPDTLYWRDLRPDLEPVELGRR